MADRSFTMRLLLLACWLAVFRSVDLRPFHFLLLPLLLPLLLQPPCTRICQPSSCL
jgi:hypothetical protein